jgi:hypothetical protein
LLIALRWQVPPGRARADPTTSDRETAFSSTFWHKGTIASTNSVRKRKGNAMRHRLGFALAILGFAPAIFLAGSLLSGCGGQRFIKVRIERDGAPVLQTEYGVSDSLDPAAIWRGLQGDSFDAVGTVTPAVDDPQKAVLKGKIRIVILHVNNEIAAAKVNELRLTRASGSGNQWKLASGEVDRTAQAAGL